jgi:hypothetical protein
MSLAALRWLLPAALYRSAGLAQPIEDLAAVRPPRRLPDWPRDEGPAVRALDAVLQPLLPPGTVRRGGADYGDPPNAAAAVRYRGRDGGYLRVLRRRLTRPLLFEALVDATHGDFVRVRPTGTEVAHCDDDRSDTHRLVIVRPNGTLWIIDSIGLPTTGAAAPLSSDQLESVVPELDNAGGDAGGDENPAFAVATAGSAHGSVG